MHCMGVNHMLKMRSNLATCTHTNDKTNGSNVERLCVQFALSSWVSSFSGDGLLANKLFSKRITIAAETKNSSFVFHVIIQKGIVTHQILKCLTQLTNRSHNNTNKEFDCFQQTQKKKKDKREMCAHTLFEMIVIA